MGYYGTDRGRGSKIPKFKQMSYIHGPLGGRATLHPQEQGVVAVVTLPGGFAALHTRNEEWVKVSSLAEPPVLSIPSVLASSTMTHIQPNTTSFYGVTKSMVKCVLRVHVTTWDVLRDTTNCTVGFIGCFCEFPIACLG